MKLMRRQIHLLLLPYKHNSTCLAASKSDGVLDGVHLHGGGLNDTGVLGNFSNLSLPAFYRLVFTSDGVIVGVVIRGIEQYVLVKIKPTESEAEH